MATRTDLARIAQTQVGYVDPAQYWEVVLPGGPPYPHEWCGAFYLWSLWAAELCRWPWVVGKGFVWAPDGTQRLPKVEFPELGDLLYLAHPFQHHAMLIDARDPEYFLAWAGNIRQGKQVGYQLIPRQAVACFSVDQLVR